MGRKIRVAILDDHQSIIDGYLYRFNSAPDIEVVGTANYGEDLTPLLTAHPADVLLLDISVPTSADNRNPYPVLHLIPQMLQSYPGLAILVISMLAERTLIRGIMDAGANGFILKDDYAAIQDLSSIVVSVASGGIYLSQQAHQAIFRRPSRGGEGDEPTLTVRQTEALSLSAAYPNWSTVELAARMGVTNSTVRNLLSGAYLRLDVRNRAAAISKARQLGLITPIVTVHLP